MGSRKWTFHFLALSSKFQNTKWWNDYPVGFQDWIDCNNSMYDISVQSGLKRHSQPSMCDKKTQDSTRCVSFFLANFADLNWQKVKCDEYRFSTMVCMIPRKAWKISKHTTSEPPEQSCQQYEVRRNSSCFKFEWKKKKELTTCFPHLELFKVLVTAVAIDQFPGIFVRPTVVAHSIRHFAVYEYKLVSVSNSQHEGFCRNKYVPQKHEVSAGVFLCKRDTYISSQFFCDDMADCPGDRPMDEIHCNCSSQSKTYLCKVLTKHNKCSPLFYTSHEKTCFTFVFEANSTAEDKDFCEKCNQRDTTLDHGTSMSKEILSASTRNFERSRNTKHPCQDRHQIPCQAGKQFCFDVSQICQFRRDASGNLQPCPLGQHLQECEEFECNLMFKCPFYYCVPWTYVCNGIWDCPFGADESSAHDCGMERSCRRLFKCRQHQVCIHWKMICNNKYDCPLGDDEAMCLLHQTFCPPACHCVTFAVRCDNLNITQRLASSLSGFRVLVFHDYKIISNKAFFTQNTFGLFMRNSHMKAICSSLQAGLVSTKLKFLDMQFNEIGSIEKGCWKAIPWVVTIVLSNNNIIQISRSAFGNLTHCKYFNISNNPIQSFDQHALANLSSLKILSIENISLKGTEILQALRNAHFVYLETEHNSLCCEKENSAQCSQEIPWFVSCSDLLINNGIKISCYTITAVILMANSASTVLHVISYKYDSDKARSNNLLVIAANVVDLICSIPLIILWIEDLIFKGLYFQIESTWKSSLTCYIISCLFLLFNFLSPFVLCLLALSRLSIVLCPIDSKFKDSTFVIKCILSTFISVVLIAIICTTVEWSINFYVIKETIPMGICSPFVDPQNHILFIKIFSWLVVIAQIVAVVIIIVCYVMLVKSLRESQRKIKDSVSKQQSNVPLIVQLLVVTSSNVLCWIPTATLYVVSMFLEQYPIKMIVWTIIVVNPVNSVVNPVVFVVIVCRKFLC